MKHKERLPDISHPLQNLQQPLQLTPSLHQTPPQLTKTNSKQRQQPNPMASPAPSALSPTAADGAPPPTKTQEQITFRFCRECSNMLYPKEDRLTNKLMFACRTCQFSEEASSSCVFRNNMYNTVGETAGVTQDVGSDPTVRDVLCFRVFDLCCTLCGVVLVEREEEEEEEGGEEEKGRGVRVFDLGDMSVMENADDEMDEGAGYYTPRLRNNKGP